MCTLLVRFDPGRPDPVLLLANRDERLDRPAEGWTVRASPEGTRYAAPRDLTAGGTWVGVNAHGLVVALTNHSTGQAPDPARRSRGWLVEALLGCRSTRAAVDTCRALEGDAFNPFHLVLADAHHAHLWHTGAGPAVHQALSPGVHVVTEVDAQGGDARGRAVAAAFTEPLTAAAARALMGVHRPEPRASTCLHWGELYGTRSSALLWTGPAPALWVAEGPPCITAYDDRSALLTALRP